MKWGTLLFSSLLLKNKDILSGAQIVNDFFPRYMIKKADVLKYNNIYYDSADFQPPRYVDLNVIYITTNYYLFQKLRSIYNMRFLPYITYWSIPYIEEYNSYKSRHTKNIEFKSWKTYSFNTSTPKISAHIINIVPMTKFCKSISINSTNQPYNIQDLVFCIGLANEVYIQDKNFKYTIVEPCITDLCNWLGCGIENQIINTTNLNAERFNKLNTLNNTFIIDYIFNVTKTIPINMSYTEFLNSTLW